MLDIIKIILTIILSIMSITGYLPQIIKCIKTKNASDLSFLSWLIWCIETTLWLILLIIDNSSLKVIMLEVVSVLFNYTTLFLIIKYSKIKMR